jgi:hypothetical protein
MTEHQPCKQHESKAVHRSEGVPFCRDCEIDTLRGLLREVVNCPESEYEQEGEYYIVEIPAALWNKILPLRTPPVVVVNGEVKP